MFNRVNNLFNVCCPGMGPHLCSELWFPSNRPIARLRKNKAPPSVSGARGREPRGARQSQNAGRRRQFLLGVFRLLSLLLARTEASWLVASFC